MHGATHMYIRMYLYRHAPVASAPPCSCSREDGAKAAASPSDRDRASEAAVRRIVVVVAAVIVCRLPLLASPAHERRRKASAVSDLFRWGGITMRMSRSISYSGRFRSEARRKQPGANQTPAAAACGCGCAHHALEVACSSLTRVRQFSRYRGLIFRGSQIIKSKAKSTKLNTENTSESFLLNPLIDRIA